VGYFTNQYPAVSHTFIRREIQALEELGVSVFRYALRPGLNLVDVDDKVEKSKTRYILELSIAEVTRCCFATLFSHALGVSQAIWLSMKIGWHSDRGMLRHIAYVGEAAVLVAWCRRERIQHLHAHFGTNSAAIAMLASRMSGVPYSFTAHGPDEFEKAELLSLHIKLEYARFAVCVSSFGRSQLMRWSRPNLWQKIAIVHCGLARSFLDGPIQPLPSARRLVCVGRIDVQKAQLVLISAARRLHEARIDFEIVLAGDGAMRPCLEDAIRQAGLEREITITGWISGDRVKAEILAARALVLPSFAENMPVVIMEALALGRPVISTYVAGIPELVLPGKTGWLVPAGDEIALANAMRDVLEASVERLTAMGDLGHRHIAGCHDALHEAVKLKYLFEQGPTANSVYSSGRTEHSNRKSLNSRHV
jgi:colanic acid/amylovoran biosynthesis glycosyltransferase